MIGELVDGKYRIESALGAGGMGAVWVAVQETLGRQVALKVVHGDAVDDASRARFEAEAKIVAGLRCPHVVKVFDFGEHAGAPYIVFELLEGESLRARLQRGPLSVEEALATARDVACGLRSAHEMGIVHRDLKPDNIVLVPDKDRGVRAMLLDFGIATSVRLPDVGGDGGAIVGTAGYIAPETIRRRSSDDPRSDLYALGVTLFEMVAGAPPLEAATPLALLNLHATTPAPDVRARRSDVPAPMAALIARLLSKEPDMRPRDGDALVSEIDVLRARLAPTAALAPLQDAATSAALSPPDRPSVAVQPFVAMGGSDEDVFFGDAIGEEILVSLARFKQLFVISQFSMIQPLGRDSDALRVGAALGVRYVVQGSVRRGGERLRVAAKLVGAETGEQLWAGRYDRPSGDLFELQDEIAQRVVACVAAQVEVAQAERARRLPTRSMRAYDWLARGRALHHRSTVEDNRRSREALDRAVEIDPDCAAAHAWRACAHGQGLAMGLEPQAEAAAQLMTSLNRALALDEADSECHRMACEVAFMHRDLVKAEHHHRRAIALNPNDARIVAQAGELLLYTGDLDEALARVRDAARLDPINPRNYLRLQARIEYVRGDLDEAHRLLHCLEPTGPNMLALYAAVAAARGDAADARAFAERTRALSPQWTASDWQPPFIDATRLARWRAGYEAAGLAGKGGRPASVRPA